MLSLYEQMKSRCMNLKGLLRAMSAPHIKICDDSISVEYFYVYRLLLTVKHLNGAEFCHL